MPFSAFDNDTHKLLRDVFDVFVGINGPRKADGFREPQCAAEAANLVR